MEPSPAPAETRPADETQKPAPTTAADGRRSFAVSGACFLRGLALVYAVAFGSLWTQLDGLLGCRGVLPAAEFFSIAWEREGVGAWFDHPSLFWISAADFCLRVVCGGGLVLAAAALVAPYSCLLWVVLWALYLSLANAGQDFLGFQWDALLLECGFLAVFLAPPRLVPRVRGLLQAGRVVPWLFRWLLFRLMFSSGVVKLASDDPVWWDLTALVHHYLTQPLPPWTAWHAHQLPQKVQVLSCFVLFAIELLVPLFVFGPRSLRLFSAGPLLLLQVLIVATGNYCFFNVLACLLSLFLVDDRAWSRLRRKRAGSDGAVAEGASGPVLARRSLKPWPRWAVWPLAVPLVVFGAVLLVNTLGRFSRVTVGHAVEVPRFVFEVYRRVAPFHIVSSYGLFADMTTERREIVIEGSNDGREWKPYEFRWKPGGLARRPRFVAPHQPRLDWQMWFAALGPVQFSPWFVYLCRSLLEGSPPVLALLETNPFPGAPPRYLRAVLYDYRFTSSAERRESGNWWKRTHVGAYFGPVSREVVERILANHEAARRERG